MLRIVTDGAADILPDGKLNMASKQFPLIFCLVKNPICKGVELDNEGFYKLVEESKRIPKTSQPTPHQFVEFYRKVAQKGDTILSIHITAKLSGTYASAIAAAEELKDDFKVIPIDSACRLARNWFDVPRSPQDWSAPGKAWTRSSNILRILNIKFASS